MKIMTILGTRPEIIRLSVIIKKLDCLCNHVLVYTGQNYTKSLSEIFFSDLGIRNPDYNLDIKEHLFGKQLGRIMADIEALLEKEAPDKVLILGDTNSALSAIIAERMGIPVFHMEAGNRCHDLKVPEEKNRRIIDSISSYALPYTPGSRENLISDGIPRQRIYLCGNPIFEVLCCYMGEIERSVVLDTLKLIGNRYILVTIHRSENVDTIERLEQILIAIDLIQKKTGFKIIFSVHPRTRQKLEKFNFANENSDIEFCEPFGFFDFITLEKNANIVLTDSGTVQEECCIFNIPVVTVRDTTERPETVECGSNIVSGIDCERIVRCAALMSESERRWNHPEGYLDKNVSDKVVNFILSK